MILALSNETTFAGIGAILLGLGSALSGWAALRRAKDEHKEKEMEREMERERDKNLKQSIDGE